jgi:glucokinase
MTQTTTEPAALGIDLGGTKIALALVDTGGRVLAQRRLDTEADAGPEAALDAMIAQARELIAEGRAPVAAVGVGAAGQVDRLRGILRSSPNLPRWRDVPLGRRLSDALGRPVAITNDGSAIALAEQAHGAGRGHDDVVVLFVGTGVGGGVIGGGRLLDGAHGYGGEIGHTTLVADGRPCSCRNRGCLEAYVGGWAIAERAREAAGRWREAGERLLRAAGEAEGGGAFGRITAATVGRAAGAGDPLARELVDETGRLLGHGLVSLIHAFNPRRVVVGGGVIDGMTELLSIAERVAREHVMEVFLDDLEIVPAALGAEAGVVGAARLAIRTEAA